MTVDVLQIRNPRTGLCEEAIWSDETKQLRLARTGEIITEEQQASMWLRVGDVVCLNNQTTPSMTVIGARQWSSEPVECGLFREDWTYWSGYFPEYALRLVFRVGWKMEEET